MGADISIAIDASRNRSGGAIDYLIGVLSELDPVRFGFSYVHVWSYRTLLDRLPDYPWLVKHNPVALEQSLVKQMLWQLTSLRLEVRAAGCSILFTTDASTLCRFKPMVVLSQDMLSYEPGVMKYFGYGFARLRLELIYYLQNLAFRHADGVIFLTRYAGRVIQQSCGSLSNVAYIPHGVDEMFRRKVVSIGWPESRDRPIRCVYVSNAEMYKHQWVVVEAVSRLRSRGYNLQLCLVGGGRGHAQKILQKAIATFDPAGEFVGQLDFVAHATLPEILGRADLFVFASSCENMPITLLEAMAMGLPIVCSNRGPMPEVLEDGGLFFDPDDAADISAAIEQFIESPELRRTCAQRALSIARRYSWGRCADETYTFVKQTFLRANS